MEKYVLLTRSNTGFYVDKVTVMADLEFCREVLQTMIYANKNACRAEIIQGDRDYIGDFRVKPIQKFGINMHRTLVRDTNEDN